MFKKICSLTILSLIAVVGLSSVEIEYEIQEIGTLQTKSSEAIAINARSQILGWYNIDGTPAQKHFFMREKNGSFHELPAKENGTGVDISWRFLTDDGKAYGTYNNNVLYVWDLSNGVVKLGTLPGNEIMAINTLGQVLLKSIAETENGRSMKRPVIWNNGKVTKLRGLEGDIGIESDESYGLDMNNKGEVVGYSVAYLSYKNEIYKQNHAVKWVNGSPIDLHTKVAKSTSTQATIINDLGDVVVGDMLVREDGRTIGGYSGVTKKSNKLYFINSYSQYYFIDREGKKNSLISYVNSKVYNDYDSIWMYCSECCGVNDNGEVIAKGSTIYQENHAMLLAPKR